jgi:hypothetical protein
MAAPGRPYLSTAGALVAVADEAIQQWTVEAVHTLYNEPHPFSVLALVLSLSWSSPSFDLVLILFLGHFTLPVLLPFCCPVQIHCRLTLPIIYMIFPPVLVVSYPVPVIFFSFSVLSLSISNFFQGYFDFISTLFNTASSAVPQIPLCRKKAGIELRTSCDFDIDC